MTTLAIESIYEFEGGRPAPMGYYAKGHHEEKDFRNALASYLKLDDVGALPEGTVRHELWRCVPVGEKGMGSVIQVVKKRGRGVFPVTDLEVGVIIHAAET